MKLEKLNLTELNAQEVKSVEGGKVPFWMYIMAPGTAYIIEKFENGCQCNVL